VGSGEQLYLTVGALQQSYTPESEVSQWGSTQVIYGLEGPDIRSLRVLAFFASSYLTFFVLSALSTWSARASGPSETIMNE